MNLNKKLLIAALCPLFALFVSCKEEILHKGKTPLVGVGKEILYKEDVQRFYEANPPAGDSAKYVHEYINRWVEEALFYDVARRNIPVKGEVEKLVESYKRSLILSIYQEGLVEQHLKSQVTMEDIRAFYEGNTAMFELEEPLMKGVFIKVPVKAPKLNQVRKWYKSRDADDLDKLEKYSLAHDVVYEYAPDVWERVSALAAKSALSVEDLTHRLRQSSDIEFKDAEFVYFISADTLVHKGALKPLELVEGDIRELVVNTLKADFVKEKKRNIYDDAVKRGAIEYYE